MWKWHVARNFPRFVGLPTFCNSGLSQSPSTQILPRRFWVDCTEREFFTVKWTIFALIDWKVQLWLVKEKANILPKFGVTQQNGRGQVSCHPPQKMERKIWWRNVRHSRLAVKWNDVKTLSWLAGWMAHGHKDLKVQSYLPSSHAQTLDQPSLTKFNPKSGSFS